MTATTPPVALVTGAARDIGRATALECARRGHHLALLDILEKELAATAAEARQLGADVLAQTCDLEALETIEACLERSVERFGRLDVLVNNAAWREVKTMREMSVESWERTLRICLTAPAFLSRWAAKIMEPRRRGVIIHVSSIMSQRGGGISPSYVAAKGGLDSLTYELAALYGAAGIRVLSVNPGAIDTEIANDYVRRQVDSVADEMRAWSEDAIPLGRWGRPEEVARMICVLAGDDASYLTGTNIVIDGGWSQSHFPQSLLAKIDAEQAE